LLAALPLLAIMLLFACILPITTPANGGVGVVLASLLLRQFSYWALLSLVPLLLLASYKLLQSVSLLAFG
jgi:hypothetical protein